VSNNYPTGTGLSTAVWLRQLAGEVVWKKLPWFELPAGHSRQLARRQKSIPFILTG